MTRRITRHIRPVLVTLLVAVGAISSLEAAAVSPAGATSCSVGPTYGNSKSTSADCSFSTPPYTRGMVASRQTCSTSSGNYTQYGPVKVAPSRTGWTGVSITPTCPGTVVARWYYSDIVPSAYY